MARYTYTDKSGYEPEVHTSDDLSDFAPLWEHCLDLAYEDRCKSPECADSEDEDDLCFGNHYTDKTDVEGYGALLKLQRGEVPNDSELEDYFVTIADSEGDE